MKYFTNRKLSWITFLSLVIGVTISCENKEMSLDIPMPVLAKFSYEIEEDSIVTFINKSVGATEYTWDFGDGTTSTEREAQHTYFTGDYEVKLLAKGASGENEFSTNININPVSDIPEDNTDDIVAEALEILTGGSVKSWSIAQESEGYTFGPLDDETVNWFVVDQYDPDVFNTRSCLFDSKFTFNTDGIYTRDMNGSVWKEWQFFAAEGCHDISEPLLTRDGVDVEVWKDGEFTFEIKNDNGVAVIEIIGMGGYIGHFTSGVNSSDFTPKEFHKYEIKSISNNEIKLSSLGYNGDSPVNPAQADRLVRMILVPAQDTPVEEEEEENSVDLDAVLQLLHGGDTKSWSVAEEENAYNFGPRDSETAIWWGFGTAEIEGRPCIFDNEFIFNTTGEYTRNMNNSVWKDWKIFDDVVCEDTAEELITKNGDNVDVWKDGSFTYSLTVDNGDVYINVDGLGGYIGAYNSGVDAADYLPHDTHTYKIISIEENRLELFSLGYGGDSDELENYDANTADRSIRLTLVPNVQ